VFKAIDYLSRWVQEKTKSFPRSRSAAEKHSDEVTISRVETVISRIPPKVIASRAVDCKSYARALFHLEQYIRYLAEDGSIGDAEQDDLYEKLQEIYMEIDEPDGIEGISSCIHALTMEQQILEDRKAGRWAAVQNWYEVQLEDRPNDAEVQHRLFESLKESGQYGECMMVPKIADESTNHARPFAEPSRQPPEASRDHHHVASIRRRSLLVHR
jgi:serine/threonine-protein kinase ATR